MTYTVKQLAHLAGISVRTLHYYDQIGLLKPSFVKSNGYRCYEEKELVKLQQILFFRELEFPLEKIKQIMLDSNFDAIAAMTDQQKLLELKKQRIERLLQTITQTILLMKGGESMSDDTKFSAFNDPSYQQYKDEVEKRWGHTDAYKQSRARVGKMSKADLERVKEEGDDIANSVTELMVKGFPFDSPEVQKQIDRFYHHLENFYEPNYEMFSKLGQMYVNDPRFSEYYEKRAKGLSIFMRDAMGAYVRIHEKH